MPWVRIDETLPSHPKFLSVGVRGIGLFVAGLCYANQYLTDGFLPTGSVSTVGGEDMSETINKLVKAGLWVVQDNGWQVHDFHEYQPKKRAVLRERKQGKRRKQRWLAVARRTETERKQNGRRTEKERKGNANPVPTRPDPSHVRTLDRSSDVLSTVVPQDKGVALMHSTTPPVLTFPCVGQAKLWDLSQPQLDNWQQAYPNLDVVAECRKSLAWINANDDHKKTAKGMPRFLVAWLNRAVDHRSVSVRGRPGGAIEVIRASNEAFLRGEK